jgi:ABC-type lipoprotein export system ATPase subunit
MILEEETTMSISLKNISHFYLNRNLSNIEDTTVSALLDINLSIQNNSLLVIFGPSGSGKTTLLKIIGSLINPLSGELFFGDLAVKKLTLKEKEKLLSTKIGYLSQNITDNLLTSLSVNEMIDILKTDLDILNKDIILKILRQIGFDSNILTVPTKNLSGGEKQRIALLLLLIRKPDYLILDEPTSHLDAENIEAIKKLILKLKNLGKTIIIATHDRNLISTADAIIFLEDGKIQSFSSLSLFADLTDQTLLFKSRPSDSITTLKIPEKIFSQIQIDFFYNFNLTHDDENKQIFNLRICNKDDLKTKDLDKWIYLDDPIIEIPSQYQKYKWTTNTTYWYINKEGIQFILRQE